MKEIRSIPQSADICVCCGMPVPEGRMVCYACEMGDYAPVPNRPECPAKGIKKAFGRKKEKQNDPQD